MRCVCECHRGGGGTVVMDVTRRRLWKYDLRKGDLFVLSWAIVRRESISPELLMCGGGVRSILLFPHVVSLVDPAYHTVGQEQLPFTLPPGMPCLPAISMMSVKKCWQCIRWWL